MKIDQLTFTRFIAAISIVIYHYGIHTPPFSFPYVQEIFKFANLGVSYFFLLSGFILTIVYSQREAMNKTGFWIARLARVYPLYLVSLCLILLPKLFTSGISILLSTRMFVHTFLLQSWYPPYTMKWNYPAWSLSVEIFFYFLFPFLLICFHKWKLRLFLLFSIFLWLVSMLTYYFLSEKNSLTNSNLVIFVNFGPLFHLPTFILGIAIGRIYREVKPIINQLLLHCILLISGFFFLFLIYCRTTFSIDFHIAFFSPVFGILILALSWCKTGISKLFSLPSFVFLGEISFGIYILQEPVHILYDFTLGKLELSQSDHLYIYLIVLVLLSALFYKIVEIPARNMIKNFTKYKRPIVSQNVFK